MCQISRPASWISLGTLLRAVSLWTRSKERNGMLVHEHLLVRATVEKPIGEPQAAFNLIEVLLGRLGLTLLCPPIAAYCSDPGNRGITALAAVTTSHVALHKRTKANETKGLH